MAASSFLSGTTPNIGKRQYLVPSTIEWLALWLCFGCFRVPFDTNGQGGLEVLVLNQNGNGNSNDTVFWESRAPLHGNRMGITIQWLGGTGSELGVFIFPMKWGASWSYLEFPNHLVDEPIMTWGWHPAR